MISIDLISRRMSLAYASIQSVTTTGEDSNPSNKFLFGDHISVNVTVKVEQPIENPALGVTIWQRNVSQPIFASNTIIQDNKNTGAYMTGDIIHFKIKLPSDLNDGKYYVEPAIANDVGTITYDSRPNAHSFVIVGSSNPFSILHTAEKISISKGIACGRNVTIADRLLSIIPLLRLTLT